MTPHPNSVTLNLSPAELKSLLSLVYLGDWMQSANDVEAPGRERDSVIDTVFQAAMDHGLTEYLRRDPVTGALAETPSLDAMLDPIIDEYNTQCFLDELCHRVAKAIHARKAGNTAPPLSKSESLDELLDLENKVNALLQPDPLPGLHVLADYAEARLKLKG